MYIRHKRVFALLSFLLLVAALSGCPGHDQSSWKKDSARLDGKPGDHKWTDANDNDKRTIILGWPIEKGVVFRTFDQTPSRIHEGLSIGAPLKTPVMVAQTGEVIFASEADNHLGKMVIVKHDEPFVSIYGHLDVIKVKVGQKLRKGDVIGTVGSTGGVESPRVYFQVRKNRMPVDPERYLSKAS